MEGLIEALGNLAKSIIPDGVPACVLQGCEITTVGTTTTVTAGIVYYDGEVFEFPQQSFTGTVNSRRLVVDQSAPKGTRTYLNGQTHVVHQYRTMTLAIDPNGSTANPDPLNLLFFTQQSNGSYRLDKQLVERLSAQQLKHRFLEDWNIVGNSGQPGFQNNWQQSGVGGGQPAAPPAFRKNVFDLVTLKGKVSNANYGSGTATVFTLPAGYRPSHKHVFTCAAADGSNNRYTVEVQPTGEVQVQVNGGSGLIFLYLSGIQFYAD